MARRRFQHGSVTLRGKRDRLWVGRWREDELRPDGTIHRKRHAEVLGTLKDYPTKRLAQRALETRLAEVNRSDYRPRPTITFGEFAEKWKTAVLVNHKPSGQSSLNSHLRCALVPTFGALQLKDITVERVQQFVSSRNLSPTTVRNHIATLRLVWNTAKDWGYVTHDPTRGLTFPKPGAEEPRFFTIEEMRQIINAASEPWKSLFWVASETGLRIGELVGLRPEDIDVDASVLRVRQSVWMGTVQTTKTARGKRICVLSRGLSTHLAPMVNTQGEMPFLFATVAGRPLSQVTVRRHLWLICDGLGIRRAGMHAFRHGNETVMAHLNAPPKLRQQRLGHSDERMMLRYEHVISEDEVSLASKLGKMLVGSA